ncbi:hypothetical protein ACJX0J_023295, partial [Zea mays]
YGYDIMICCTIIDQLPKFQSGDIMAVTFAVYSLLDSAELPSESQNSSTFTYDDLVFNYK